MLQIGVGGRVKIGPPPYIYKIPLPDNYKNTTALSSPPRTTGNEQSVVTPHSPNLYSFFISQIFRAIFCSQNNSQEIQLCIRFNWLCPYFSFSHTSLAQTVPMKPGVTYNTIGNTTFGSDGTSYNTIGNTTFGSDGTSYNSIGTPHSVPMVSPITPSVTPHSVPMVQVVPR